MNNRKRLTYCVAEHYFVIEAPETDFELMTNYAPFIAELPQGVQPLYELQVSEPQDALPDVPAEWETVYMDRTEEDMPRIEIYRNNGNWILREAVSRDAECCMQITATPDFAHCELLRIPMKSRFAVDNAAMLLFAFSSARFATLEMHASVTVRGDLGYLFLGKSGTGKSTHSRLWQECFKDAWLLNDDNPVVRLKEDGAYVYGSPWSGKTPCYKNDVRRIGAFVKLAQAPYNKMHTLRLPEAYAYILSSSSGLKIVPQVMDQLYDTISRLIQTVQVYGLECLPDTAAAELCAQTVMPKA